MIYRLVQQWQEKAVSITQACRVLGVSRSGFYQHRQRAVCPKDRRASVQIKAVFTNSGKSYGSRRVCQALAQAGAPMGRFRVRRLMREHGLRPVWRPKYVNTTESQHAHPIAPNLLQRQFTVAQPNRVWATDITYIPTRQGWLYLAAVMDVHSRKIVGWAMAPSMPAELVVSALQMAVQQRRPAPGLIHHSDRGAQYASHTYQALLTEYGMRASMSAKGDCWDNAVMERFFLSLKVERVRQRDYANHIEARKDIVQYIVGFYNSVRLHSTLGYATPADYELQTVAKTPV